MDSSKPILKSSAATSARLFCFMAQNMALNFMNGNDLAPSSPIPNDTRHRRPSTKSTTSTKSIINRDALSHFIDLVYDACTACSASHKSNEIFSQDLLNAIAHLLVVANVWEDQKLHSVGQVGFAILLQFCCQSDLELSTTAAEHVQSVLQNSNFVKEAIQFGYMIARIYEAAILADTNVYYTLMPILKTALQKMRELALNLRFPLPSLQYQHGSFSESFQQYSDSTEWKSFMDYQALPWKAKFMADYLAVSKDRVASDFLIWHSEALERQDFIKNSTYDSWALFQEKILHPLMSRTRSEHQRLNDFAKLLISERENRQQQFRHIQNFQMGDCGCWPKHKKQSIRWKLGNMENWNRMRLSMIQNFNFDQHASSALENFTGKPTPTKTFNDDDNDFSALLMAPINVDQQSQNNDDEDWTQVSLMDAMPSNIDQGVEAIPQAKAVINEICDLISIAGVISGRLEVTNERFSFSPSEIPVDEDSSEVSIQFPFSEVRDVYLRRYNLQKTALEVFLVDCRNYMLNFADKTTRNKAFVRLIGLKNQSRSNIFNFAVRDPKQLLKLSGATQKWINREMTNFDYLMAINTYAGRTYNDLSQYIIFPWIIADYNSRRLNLDDPKTYRDLSKPMGAQNPKKAEEVKEKYDQFEDPSMMMHKFHYGTHYSNAATVMYYLLRVEPFATLHIDLQSGHFDVPDRLFNSIPGLYRSLYNGNDVKELIPEFFFMPELLVNLNEFDFGHLQLSEEKVDNVHLPPWAESPEDFIYKHRQALESDYVSNHLHEWIDLIFGYKQRGQHAVEALNVYHACTYEDQIDVNAVTDPERRNAIESMVTHFGQTPTQLFTEPHPKRLTIEDLFKKVASAPQQYSVPLLSSPFSMQAVSLLNASSFEPNCFINHCGNDTLVMVSRSGTIRVYPVTQANRADSMVIQGFSNANDNTVGHPRPSVRLQCDTPKSQNFSVLDNGSTIAVVGFHDNSLRLIQTKSGKLIAAVRHHAQPVTCLSLSKCNRFIATGSEDVTVAIFRLVVSHGQTTLLQQPHTVLFGHDSAITSVALCTDIDICWSCGENGMALAHTVRKGRFVRALKLIEYLPGIKNVRIENVKVAPRMSEVIFYAHVQQATSPATRYLLCAFSANGRYLASLALKLPIADFILSGDAVIYADSRPHMSIRKLYKFQQLSPVAPTGHASTSEMALERPATAMALANNGSTLFVALDDGRLLISSFRSV